MPDKKPGIDKELIRELAALLKETDLSEIEIEQDDFRIRVSRGGPVAGTAVVPAEARAQPVPPKASEASPTAPLTDPARHPGCVPSPMVGTAYRSPEPGKSPFVEAGDQVQVGQTILIVEAMKHMNEVASPRAGKVIEILVEDGQPLEYGQPLMIIE
jgi:acetyl-CoA carboxylase biotin carboxyl carrier protein